MSSRQASRRVCDSGARPDGRSTAPPGRSSVPMASSLSQSDIPAPRPRLRSGLPAPGPRGSPCARSRNNTIRAATATLTLTAFSSRSQVSKRRSSTLQPLLSTKWTSSIGHRQVYFRTTSCALSAVAAGSSVQSSQCAARGPPVARVPIPPPGSRSSARRADISGGPAPTSLVSTALPPPHAAQGRRLSTHLNHGPAQDRPAPHRLVRLGQRVVDLAVLGTADDRAVASVRDRLSSPRRRPPRGPSRGSAAAPAGPRPPGTARCGTHQCR